MIDAKQVLEAMALEKKLGITIRSPRLEQAARELARFHRDGNRAMRRAARQRGR